MRPPQISFPARIAFVAAFVLAILFAFYTSHVWEDYYITYRSSRNLAEGHGLVFNQGERLHTFTSPLGVLLPALASWLTGTHSDSNALWVFRIMSAAALGGAAWLLTRSLQRTGLSWMGVALPVAWLATDAKVLDFTINGMETAFMLLFLAYAVWSHVQGGKRRWLHLGIAWAGLMWSRPDSFIYIGLLAAGFWLFNDESLTGRSRGLLLKEFLIAGLITSALYLPWLGFAAAYYGTPVPHTITAKSGIGDPRTMAGLVSTALQLPYLAWTRFTSLEGTFLPSYYMMGGWPQPAVVTARVIAILASVIWVLPGVPRFARATSFAFFGAHVYLTYFPYFPFPWYIPSSAILAALALGGALGAVAARRAVIWRWLAGAGMGLALVGGLWLTVEVARQVRAQQRLIEDGGRRRIGEWLHANAASGDTVFMEPLGYIGYFSGLRTFDFPGMSSREMVAARQIVGTDWAHLIFYLQPSWVVLRPRELERVNSTLPHMLSTNYHFAERFDTLSAVEGLTVRGRRYLEHDAVFLVFRRVSPMRHDADFAQIACPFGWSESAIDNQGVLSIHAPSLMILKVPPGARRMRARFGFFAGAIEPPNETDGATFMVWHSDHGHLKMLFSQTLMPLTRVADRGLHEVDVELPANASPGSMLILRTDGNRTADKDWTAWTKPEFR